MWQYSQENTWLESLFDKVAGLKTCIFIEKDLHVSTQVLFCEYCENIENGFFIEQLLLIILFWDFCVIVEFFRRLPAQNWYFLYFFYYCFVFFHNSNVKIESPWLFCTCIYKKTFSKYSFRRPYNVRIRNNIQYYTNFSQ